MGQLATAIVSLVSSLAPLALQAAKASKEQHDQIIIEAQIALTAFNDAIGNLSSTIAQDDVDADAAIKSNG